METSASAAFPSREASSSARLSRLSDELLARYVARGSSRAFAVVFERYHRSLYRYCRSIVRHDADAQDALQSTFTAAFSALRRDQRNAPLRPWLFRIAHNQAISILRSRAREDGSDVAVAAVTAASAEEKVIQRARWEAVLDDLGAIPERQRSALLLRELNGLSHEEIAAALGSTVGAAKQAIYEARQALSELHEGRAMSCEEIRRRLSDGDRRVIRGRRVRAHLRSCSGCAEFEMAIRSRRADLRAFVPVLPAGAAAGVFTRTINAVSAHGSDGLTASGAATGGSAPGAIGGVGASGGVTATGGAVTGSSVAGTAAGTTVATKAVVGALLVAAAASGAVGLSHALRHDSRKVSPATHVRAYRRETKTTVGVAKPGALYGSTKISVNPARGRAKGGRGAPSVRIGAKPSKSGAATARAEAASSNGAKGSAGAPSRGGWAHWSPRSPSRQRLGGGSPRGGGNESSTRTRGGSHGPSESAQGHSLSVPRVQTVRVPEPASGSQPSSPPGSVVGSVHAQN